MTEQAFHEQNKIYQVSTLQALLLGYNRSVITTGELLRHGSIGLGTFENLDGEMIVLDGHCYRAMQSGDIMEPAPDTGVPFSAVTFMQGERTFPLAGIRSIRELKEELTVRVEEGFGLNSVHVARIDGMFRHIDARSAAPYYAPHVPMKEVMGDLQRTFTFDEQRGTMVCVYFPDYLDGINAEGWHLHFITEDRSRGGHVLDLSLTEGTVGLLKLSSLELRLPLDPSFDTYSLHNDLQDDIRQVETGT